MVYFVSLDIYEGIGLYTLVCQTLLSIGYWQKYTYDTCDPYEGIGHTYFSVIVSLVCREYNLLIGGYTFEISKGGGT